MLVGEYRALALPYYSPDLIPIFTSVRCSGGLTGIYVPITIKDKHGNVIKSATKQGIRNVEDIIMWICRELMISMLETGDSAHATRVSLMLVDMDDFVGWQGLDKMIRGGRRGQLWFYSILHQNRISNHLIVV